MRPTPPRSAIGTYRRTSLRCTDFVPPQRGMLEAGTIGWGVDSIRAAVGGRGRSRAQWVTRGLSVVVSGAEVGEQESHTKQQPAGCEDKCRMRSEAFQSRQAMSLVAMGKIDGREPSVKPNLGSTLRPLREPRPLLHSTTTRPARGAVRVLAPREWGQRLQGALTMAVVKCDCCASNAVYCEEKNCGCRSGTETDAGRGQSLMRSMNQAVTVPG